MWDKSNDTSANLVRHIRWFYVYLYVSIFTFSHKSHEYQHNLNEFFFFLQKIEGKDYFPFCGSSSNDNSLYLKQKKLGFTEGRCLNLYALARA